MLAIVLVTTFYRAQNSVRIPRIFGPTPYPSKVFNIRSWSRLSYYFLGSNNAKKSGYWYTLASSCSSFISMIGCPRSPPREKSIEDIMERHGLIDTCINNGLHQLPEGMQEPYPSGICTALGDKDQYCPYQLCSNSSVLPHELDQLQKFHPFFWVRGLGGYLLLWVILPRPEDLCGPLSHPPSTIVMTPTTPPLSGPHCKFVMGRRGWGISSPEGKGPYH